MKSVVLFAAAAVAALGASADLYREFQDPPRTYTIRPFWFWNGKLDSKEIARQIDEMVAQGVYGAYVHNRTGLQMPYLRYRRGSRQHGRPLEERCSGALGCRERRARAARVAHHLRGH
jgi:hypothetical protein